MSTKTVLTVAAIAGATLTTAVAVVAALYTRADPEILAYKNSLDLDEEAREAYGLGLDVYDRDGNKIYGTINGIPITDALIEEMVREAEAGYHLDYRSRPTAT